MFLWDSNIVRHFAEGYPTLRLHLLRVSWAEIALPSVVVAEVLNGRCDFALKATPDQAVDAHQRLMDTIQMLQHFQVVRFDAACADHLRHLQSKLKTRKRYADVMIAATALAGRHVVVTRNIAHFVDLLPANQLVNWIDQPPR